MSLTTEKTLSRSVPRIAQKFLNNIIESLPARVAVLDDQGRIIGVNSAWLGFLCENGLSENSFELGDNYLQLCREGRYFCDKNGSKAAEGIESILAGDHDSFYMESPCQSRN